MDLQGRNLSEGLSGADVAELQKELAQLGFGVPAAEQSAASFGAGTLAAVKQFQSAHGIQATGIVDAGTAVALGRAILSSTFTVSGTVTSPTRAGVGGLAVQLVDKNVGGDVAVAAGVTDGHTIGGSIQASSVHYRSPMSGRTLRSSPVAAN
jgi:peptidoglycan hydrolase-like protein with peptidoglycan-binding domain